MQVMQVRAALQRLCIGPSTSSWRLRVATRTARRHVSSAKDGAAAADGKHVKYTSRLRAMNNKLPRFLRQYTTPLLSAPVSHISAFLVLHELTALLPLLGLAALFHYAQWLPAHVVNGAWVQAGVDKWGRYFQRKGWAEQQPQQSRGDAAAASGSAADGDVVQAVTSRGDGWNVVLEVATAWAVVKALLPVRIVGCVWMTPWFARVAIVPVMRVLGRAGGKTV